MLTESVNMPSTRYNSTSIIARSGAILILIGYISLGPAIAQNSAIPNYVRAVNALDRLTDSNGLGSNEMVYGIPLPPGKVIGDTYLSQSWKKSVILLYKEDKLLEGYEVRYDVYADELEVKTNKGIKVLKGRDIKSFMWTDSAQLDPYYFVNAADYKREGAPLAGFFEVLVDGQMPLFKKTRLTVKKANYNVALDVGSRDDKILKVHEYFLARSGEVMEVPTSRKKITSVFSPKGDDVTKFMNANDLSVKKEIDLVHIFEFYNSLSKQQAN